MRKPIIAGNWKMHNTIEETRMFALDLRAAGLDLSKVEVVICPPYLAIDNAYRTLENSGVQIGAQNMHSEPSGAFTGEVSPAMLLDAGCSWVILGHSERRQYFYETDELIAKKLRSALNVGLKPIICVGESLDERTKGKAREIVGHQIFGCLSQIGADEIEKITIAYEPVWAIGTGVVATPEQVAEMHAFIRNQLTLRFEAERADLVRILYGGSINPANIKSLISLEDVDGGLVGGASLKVESFKEIINTTIQTYN